jgi:selenium-binding protein 1
MRSSIWAAATAAAIFGFAFAGRALRLPQSERYLYIWTGDQARKKPDFLAVVDFDDSSRNYGKVIRKIPLPGPGAAGNEPHHVALSADGATLAAGGLLSVLKGQPEIFFFDVWNPAEPRLITTADPPLSSITDEFYPLAEGGFLVTMMGNAKGSHPGRVVEFSRDLKIVAEHPRQPPDDGFNPHGISVRPEKNLMVTSDFVCPSSTLHGTDGGLILRGSVRVWDFRKRSILRTISLPTGSGSIDVQLIPKDHAARAYTAGMTDDKLYLVDTAGGQAKPVFDFSTIARAGWPQLMRLTRDGTRLFITLNQAGKVVMLDIKKPETPRLMKVLDLGAASGPHYLALTRDERRLVITDYFLNEDSFGKVHAEGDHKVHVARVTDDDLVLDERFQLDFNNAFAGGFARPHGVAFR